MKLLIYYLSLKLLKFEITWNLDTVEFETSYQSRQCHIENQIEYG